MCMGSIEPLPARKWAFAITWLFLTCQITILRCRVNVVPVKVTGLNHAILNQAEIPAALPTEELQTQ